MKRLMIVVAAFVVLAASSAWASVSWSDNFNGGAQQTWTVYGNTASVMNNRYELQTMSTIASLVQTASFTDSVVQARVQQIHSGDNFLAYLMARANPGTMSGYVMGIGSPGGGNEAHLWLGKLTNGVYSGVASLTIQPTFDYTDCQAEFSLIGTTLQGKVWTTDTIEPDWQITATDSSYAAGYTGVMLATYPTLNWNSVSVAFDDVTASAVPEPATIIIWSLLGAGSWLGMRMCRQRRGGPVGRQPWSNENRTAIHDIIARGSPR